MGKLSDLFEDFVGVFYPNLCLACGNNHPIRKDVLCITCSYNLPKTDFHLITENQMTRKLDGKIKFENATAFYYFVKDGPTQSLVHNLKYKGQYQVGIHMGRHYGKILKKASWIDEIDLIIPVPLHKKKQYFRGYNQSEMLCQGLSETMNIPYSKKTLIKVSNTASQTTKGLLDRLKNVEEVFKINPRYKLDGYHILLVDDVMTTGATLIACAEVLQEMPNVKVSFATLLYVV